MSDTSFNMLGFFMAMGSNLCFSARSICAKLLRSSLGKAMDNANLFVHVNAYGILILLPLVLYFEGPVLITILMNGGNPAKLFLMNGIFYYLNNQMNFLVLEKVELNPPSRPIPSPARTYYANNLELCTCAFHPSGRALTRPVLAPSIPYVHAVLSGEDMFPRQVDAVTHGLINCGRRVANILFAIVWFKIPISLYNGAGISLALFGAFCYMQACSHIFLASTVESAACRASPTLVCPS